LLFDIIARKAVYILFRNMTPYEMLRDSYLVDIPDMPTCEGPMGIFYDFNDGARIFLPEGNWHVSILKKAKSVKTLYFYKSGKTLI
jgi:hypothetical protein